MRTIDAVAGRLRSRPVEAVVAFCLVSAMLLQRPGQIIRDTKLALALDPSGFISTAAHLWDPGASFGRVANQAAGYLFPMGPFFIVADSLNLSAWVAQRLWLGTLLVVGFLGMVMLAEELDIGRRSTQLVGALGYALAPSSLALIGFQSGAQTAHALLPLAVVPLVRGSRCGSARRAGATSALVVIAMGAANAAAVVAVLPLPVLWLLTRTRGPRRRRLLVWWAGSLIVGTLWWTVPLVLQGRFGIEFTRFTEHANVTTSSTSPVEVVRGSGVWTSYVFGGGRPWIPAGWTIATSSITILASALFAALGLWGLARRDLPERAPLLVSTAVALVAICAGWGGPLSGPFSGVVRDLLDGPFVALRNVHKFSPLLTVPVVLGWIHAVSVGLSWLEWRASDPLGARRLATLAIVPTVLLLAIPIGLGRIPLEGSFDDVPDYWSEAGAWLEEHGGQHTTLLVPGASFGEYEWGRSFDEPIESVADTPWAVRSLIPLGATGSTRLMDGVENILVRGRPSEQLSAALRRSGIKHLLVRNDLNLDRVTSPDPLVVRRVLAGSPGLRRVASFGPPAAVEIDPDRLVPDTILSERSRVVPRLEIYEVEGSWDLVATRPTADVISFNGGPETLGSLPDGGASGVVAAVSIDQSGTLEPNRSVVTDGGTRRDYNFGRVHDQRSYVLTAEAPSPNGGGAVENWLRPGEPVSVVQLTGAQVSSSSYATGTARWPEARPEAAFDGDPTTAWRVTSTSVALGQWIELSFENPQNLEDLTATFPPVRAGRARITQIEVTTDVGNAITDIAGDANRQVIAVPDGVTRRVRLTINATRGIASIEAAGIAEIEIDGLEIRRTVVAPEPSRPADLVVLERLTSDPYDTERSDEEIVLDRRIEPGAGRFGIDGTVIARPGAALLAMVADLVRGGTVETVASTTFENLPEFAPWHAIDDDPRTAWLSDPSNPEPRLALQWEGDRRISAIDLDLVDGVGRRPDRVTIASGDFERTAQITESGSIRFDPLLTDTVSISFQFEEGDPSESFIAVRDLRIAGSTDLQAGTIDEEAALDGRCRDDLGLTVQDRSVPVRLRGTIGDLTRFAAIEMEGCDAVTLGKDSIDVVMAGSATIGADRMILQRLDRPPVDPLGPGRVSSVTTWNAGDRSVAVSEGGETLLIVNENQNWGWQASFDGRPLESITVDGWKQGYVVPEGSAGIVHIRFRPDRLYRLSLLAGLIGAVLVAVAALVKGSGQWPPLDGRALPSRVVIAIAAGVVFALGGWLVVFVPLVLLVPDRDHTLPFVAAISYMGAGALVAYRAGAGGAAFDAGPQVLTALAIAATFGSAAVGQGDGRPATTTSRMASIDG